MLDVWLIPALAVLAVAVAVFYLLVRLTGGSGVRTEGRTLVHKPGEEENLPPG
jgi:hypothetical protein